MLLSTSYSGLYSQVNKDDDEISKLLKKAEENYQNGNFKEAIRIYETIIQKLDEKKELAKTKQKLFQTMISLALTHFTIMENEKAEIQLRKLIELNPKQELDPEFYPPKFIEIFKKAQKELLGSVNISSKPGKVYIYIDGVVIGQTPIIIKSYFKGEYNLTAKCKGYKLYTKKITVAPDKENKFDIVFEKKGTKKVIAKEKPKLKKKKKISPLLIIGGIAVAVTAILLLTKKSKEEPAPTLVSRTFSNKIEKDIRANDSIISFISVEGIYGEVNKIEYMVLIEHPKMKELVISLIGTDGSSTYTIWNRKDSTESQTRITGFTTTFNNIDPKGNWMLGINNNGAEKGKLIEWFLKIYYYEK